MFKRLLGFGANPNTIIVDDLYATIVAAARQPVCYSQWQVPDTPLGRFEMVSLSLFLLLHRLRGEKGQAAEIAQDLVDTFFKEVEHSIRELGIGDMGVPKRMKKLARMFYGRVESYSAALDARDEEALAAALKRNIQPTTEDWPEARHLARYALVAADSLASQPVERIVSGEVDYPEAATVSAGEAA